MDNPNLGNIKWKGFNCEKIVTKYTCKYCGFTTHLWITLNDHIWNEHKCFQNNRKTDFKMKIYSCKTCDFTSHSLLVMYLHQAKSAYVLEATEEDGFSQHEIISKTIGKDVDEIKWFKCGQCEYNTKYSGHFKRHINVKHAYENLIRNDCIEAFSTTGLKLHMSLDPLDIKWFQCDQCKYKAKLKTNLNDHINTVHAGGIRVYHKCRQCSYKCLSKSSLRYHMIDHTDSEQVGRSEYARSKNKSKEDSNLVHPQNIKRFICDQCDFKTKLKHNLNNHIKGKHNCENRVYHVCSQCSYKTIYKNSLKRHLISYHTEDIQLFECDRCDYKAKLKNNLTKHIKINHVRGSHVYYECKECSYKSIYKAHLKTHSILRHTEADNLKWFQCEHCEYKAKLKYMLTKHNLRHHSRENPVYECSQCSFTTIYKWNLSKHIIRLHSKS